MTNKVLVLSLKFDDENTLGINMKMINGVLRMVTSLKEQI